MVEGRNACSYTSSVFLMLPQRVPLSTRVDVAHHLKTNPPSFAMVSSAWRTWLLLSSSVYCYGVLCESVAPLDTYPLCTHRKATRCSPLCALTTQYILQSLDLVQLSRTTKISHQIRLSIQCILQPAIPTSAAILQT
ncbi:hypothetical protein KP509_35G016900 [Ceratopteris richardii]|uniref:Uncharacterized protein n=1 Tax=Ceratopteris richardii TaxID=49495 RepID=A0A8T2QDH7_CERRI|nr:hypothetical protein KP509_35G016900 [Ceratopteris richardii]